MNTISIKDINLGGIADSRYQGQKNSVTELVGFDIHGEPGILKHNQKLTKESGVLIDDLVKSVLPCSDGNTYLFGLTTGKVWQRTSAGVYSLLVTAAAGILDAYEYQGFIYYSMPSALGQVAVGAPTNWAGRNDAWKVLTTDADFHPFNEVNQVLYIGNGKDLAQVDAGVFSASALDLASPYRIKSLGKTLTDILLGTFVNIYRVATEIFRWNTWSTDSYQSSDDIPEIGINCFLKTDNLVLVSAGTKGNFYYYNGSQLENYKRIPGDWTGSKEATIHPNASCNMFGIPLFGLSNVSGNPVKQGVYSLGGYDRNYPKVINLEWFISNGRYAGVDIGAIEMVGTQLLVAWKFSDTITMTIANPGVVTWTAHGLSTGEPVMFTTTIALPTGITASTYYYIRKINANTFHLYDTYAHAIDTVNTTGRITTSGSQSGVHTIAGYGVDALDSTAKTVQAYFTTRVINVARNDSKTLSGYVAYRSLPNDASIKIYHKVNYAADWTEATTTVDTIRKTVYLKEAFPEANTIEIKVESNSASGANANNAPEIELAEFNFE